jgi:hypothetical protein
MRKARGSRKPPASRAAVKNKTVGAIRGGRFIPEL